MPQRLPKPKLTPEQERASLETGEQMPDSNVAYTIRLIDAIDDLNRLDKTVQRVQLAAWFVVAFTGLTAAGTLWMARSTDRLAHYAAEPYRLQSEAKRGEVPQPPIAPSK